MQTRCALVLLIVGVFVGRGVAADPYADLVKVSLIADGDAIVPGEKFTLGVLLKIKPEWHTYWINPGETGEATQIRMTGPPGLEFGPIQWPIPAKINMDGATTYGYENEVLLLVAVSVSKDLKPSGPAKIDAAVHWLSCKNTCIPGEAKLSIALPINLSSHAANAGLFKTWRARLPVTSDHPVAAEFVSRIEQNASADGVPAAELKIQWKKPVQSVDWFPIATEAVAIGNVSSKTEGMTTHVSYKCKTYRPVPGGRIESLVVYETANGERRGIILPVKVPATK